MSESEGDFDSWATTFYDHYDRGSRGEYEFRFTRKLVIAARKWTSFIDERIKQKTGYGRARWQTLAAIAFSGGPVATLELSERMGVQWPTLIRALNAMEAEGLIERTQDLKDRRYRMITISPTGRKVLEDVRQILDPLRSIKLSAFTTEELVASERMLDRLLEVMSK